MQIQRSCVSCLHVVLRSNDSDAIGSEGLFDFVEEPVICCKAPHKHDILKTQSIEVEVPKTPKTHLDWLMGKLSLFSDSVHYALYTPLKEARNVFTREFKLAETNVAGSVVVSS